MIEVKQIKTNKEKRIQEILDSMREVAEYLKYIFAGDDENYMKALNICMLLDNTKFILNNEGEKNV